MNQNMNAYNMNKYYGNPSNNMQNMNHTGNMNHMNQSNNFNHLNMPNPNSIPCKKELMCSIYEIGFALDDLVLFLDTHPSNQHALHYYHKLRKKYHDLVKMYTTHYGPLCSKDVEDEDFFTWSNKKMPWEGEV